MLQVRKVTEHVYEKIINLDNESQTTSSSNNEKPEQEKEEDIAVLAEEKIELLCQDQVSGPEECSFISLQRYPESHTTCNRDVCLDPQAVGLLGHQLSEALKSPVFCQDSSAYPKLFFI